MSQTRFQGRSGAAGRRCDDLVEKGVPENIVGQLDLLGFSGVSNVLSCIKAAKYYEMTGNDIMIPVLTNSMEFYDALPSDGQYRRVNEPNAAADLSRTAWTVYG